MEMVDPIQAFSSQVDQHKMNQVLCNDSSRVTNPITICKIILDVVRLISELL